MTTGDGGQPGSVRKRPGWQAAAGDGRGLSVNTCDCNEELETVGTSEFEWRIMQPGLKNQLDLCIR